MSFNYTNFNYEYTDRLNYIPRNYIYYGDDINNSNDISNGDDRSNENYYNRRFGITHNYTRIINNQQPTAERQREIQLLEERITELFEEERRQRERELLEERIIDLFIAAIAPLPGNDEQQIDEIEIIQSNELYMYLMPVDEQIEICAICLCNECEICDTSKLSCGHAFHTNCIKECLKRADKCPLCRRVCRKNETHE